MLLVLFPAISWLYLKNGISFRKTALEQLSDKMKFDLNDLDSITSLSMKGKISLIDLKGDTSTLSRINDQFKESSDFTILSKKEGYGVVLNNNEVDRLISKYGNKTFILIDNEGYVRKSYSGEEGEKKEMIIHIATLIPFVEKKKPRGVK